MSEHLSSEISIRFEFCERQAEDLEQLNRMLATMELTDVQLEDMKGYLAVTQNVKDNVVVNTTYRYGLDSGTLVCRKAAFEDGRRFQIATEVFPKSDEMTAEQYGNRWKLLHPEQNPRALYVFEVDRYIAFVMLYFEAN